MIHEFKNSKVYDQFKELSKLVMIVGITFVVVTVRQNWVPPQDVDFSAWGVICKLSTRK